MVSIIEGALNWYININCFNILWWDKLIGDYTGACRLRSTNQQKQRRCGWWAAQTLARLNNFSPIWILNKHRKIVVKDIKIFMSDSQYSFDGPNGPWCLAGWSEWLRRKTKLMLISFLLGKKFHKSVQWCAIEMERLLHKPYVNEVTLNGQILYSKSC